MVTSTAANSCDALFPMISLLCLEPGFSNEEIQTSCIVLEVKQHSSFFSAYIVQHSLLFNNNEETLVYALPIPVLVEVPDISGLF